LLPPPPADINPEVIRNILSTTAKRTDRKSLKLRAILRIIDNPRVNLAGEDP
jgi:hypothetical protein